VSKKGLGKGLQALIAEEYVEQAIKEIAITDIDPNPNQPREDFDEASLAELAESIKQHGLLQPLLVKPSGDRYTIIAGERRFRASKLAGLKKVLCYVQDCSEKEMAERAIIENIQRDNLSPIEEGKAYLRLMTEFGLTQEQVAERVGKGRATIANLIRITKLPEPVLELLRQEKISFGHAKLLVGLKDPSLQVLLAQQVAMQQLSVRALEEMIGKLERPGQTSATKKKKAQSSAKPPELLQIEDQLQASFQTKVELRGDLHKGKIEIAYYSQEDLSRLLELWNIRVD